MSLFTIQSFVKPALPIPSQNNCIKHKPVYPSFTPVMSNISVISSYAGQYSLVYIFGYNFFPNGATYINFGSFKNIPVTYYGSNNISFVVPLNATVGTYNVVVVNIYNGNFSPAVNFTYPGVLNYSNSYSYKII
jgi:hypothetical protein